MALLLVPTSVLAPAPPASAARPSPPRLRLPAAFTPAPDPRWALKRYTGRTLDRLVGLVWSLLWLIGFGNAALGMGNFVLGLTAWRWVNERSASAV